MASGIRKIVADNVLQGAGEHSVQLPYRNFSKGTYLVRISNGKTINTSKFVVQ